VSLPKIFRTSTFTLSLAYALWFLLSSGALFFFIHQDVKDTSADLLEDGELSAEVREEHEELLESLTEAFIWAAGLSVVLAIAGGWLTSTAFLRRVERINRTAGRIIDGRLSERIDVRGSGDELDRLAERLNVMLDRVQALVESLRQVSSDIAHDLRTPLTRLRQSLESGHTERALAECDQILATFSALLRIAQIEAGTRRAGFKPIDLSQLLETIAEIYAPVAEDAEHLFSAELAPGVKTIGDPELLTQMAANLVENAIKHTPPGTKISMRLEPSSKGFVLTLADDGPGIPEKDRRRVFDRFVRLEESRTTPGSGLGLSLAHAVVTLHGWMIELDDARPGNIARIQPVLKDIL
jgi:signal transduction histidine kinase